MTMLCSLSTGPVSKTVVLISHFDTQTWENRVQDGKYRSLPYRRETWLMLLIRNLNKVVWKKILSSYLSVKRSQIPSTPDTEQKHSHCSQSTRNIMWPKYEIIGTWECGEEDQNLSQTKTNSLPQWPLHFLSVWSDNNAGDAFRAHHFSL